VNSVHEYFVVKYLHTSNQDFTSMVKTKPLHLNPKGDKIPPMHTLASRTLAFLDTETTGLSPWFGDRICEIAILRCRGDEILASFDTLVNPARPISPGAARVNGLTDAELAGAPAFAQIAAQLTPLLEGAILVCHNAPFDLAFLTGEFGRIGQALPPLEVIDTLLLARTHFAFPSNRLQAIAQALQIESTGAHRALADVLTTRQVLGRFLANLQQLPLSEMVALYAPPVASPAAFDLPPQLQEALSANKRLFICYVDQKGRTTERWITPIQVVAMKDYIYVSARCHLRDEDRSFRLDRIIEMKLEEFSPNP
jgi:DNA polymerase III subunit epsilon